MLQSNQLLDLRLVFLITERDRRLTSLATHLNAPLRKLKHRINVLNAFLYETQGVDQAITVQPSGLVHLNDALRQQGLTPFYKLKLALLNQNYEFRILSSLTTTPHLSSHRLAQQLYISKSYLYRLVKTINVALTPLDLTITMTASTMALSGDELMIRTLGLLLNADAFQSLEWPYRATPSAALLTKTAPAIRARLAHMSVANQATTQHLLAVTATRLSGKHPLSFPASKRLWHLATLLQANDEFTTGLRLPQYDQLTRQERETEQLYLSFLSRVFLSDLYPAASKRRVGALLRQSDDAYGRLGSTLYAALADALNLTLDEDVANYFIYFLTLSLAFFDQLGNRLSALSRYVFDTGERAEVAPAEMVSTTAAVLTTFLRAQRLTIDATPATITLAAKFIATILAITQAPPAYVYLQSSRDFTASTRFRTLIHQVFNPASVMITTDVTRADIILTDAFEPPQSTATIFFYDDARTNWSAVLEAINAVILSKMFRLTGEEPASR